MERGLYQHPLMLRTHLSALGDRAQVAMPHVHRVAALLKRWWLGTHQGSISEDQMPYYLAPDGRK